MSLSRNASNDQSTPSRRQSPVQATSSETLAPRRQSSPEIPMSGDGTTSSVEVDVENNESGSLLDRLRAQAQKAEQASDKCQREFEALQSRFDKLTEEHLELKDSMVNKDHISNTLRLEKGEEAEASAASKEQYSATRSALHAIENSGPSSPAELRDQTYLVMQKDHIIEALRFELAEAHIRFVESENAEAGRINELERRLLDSKMNNARIVEENESYQILLQDKTLEGHFSSAINSLSRETTMSEVDKSDCEPSSDNETTITSNNDEASYTKKLEDDITMLKDQNKALTLYINKIISRLLQTESFESLWENKSTTGSQPNAQFKEDAQSTPSLLQRASAVFGSRARPRPQPSRSSQPASLTSPQDEIMPSIRNLDIEDHRVPCRPPLPLYRSDPARNYTTQRQSFRADHEHRASSFGGLTVGSQPGSAMLRSPRHSAYFNTTPSATDDTHETMNSKHVQSDMLSDSGYGSKPASEVPDQPSPPRSNTGSEEKQHSIGNVLSATQGNKMRPLRLVQEKNEAEEAALAERKRANRSSFIGWFGKAN